MSVPRAMLLVSIAMALGACASHRIPDAAIPPPPSSDWSAVRALTKPTFILLSLDEEQAPRRAFFGCATDTTLTVYDNGGVETFARARVARISVQDRIGTKRAPRYITIPIASAILGGLAGLVASGIAKNKEAARASAWTFGIGLLTGLVAGPMDYPRPVIAERPLYVRP